MKFFQHIGDQIDSIFVIMENSATNSTLLHQLTVIISISITLTVMIKGYAALAGKSQDPIRELMWDMVIKMVIIVFVLNIDGYLTMVLRAMEGIQQWASGGESIYAKLDELFGKTNELADYLYRSTPNTFGGALSGVLAKALAYIGFALGVLPALIVVIVTSFTLKIVLILAPFMFFALLYGWLKNMFSQWLSLFFSNILTVLIVTLVLNALIDQMSGFIDYQKGGVGSLDAIMIGLQVLIFGIILSVLINIAKAIAEKIATVSIEGIGQSGLGNPAGKAGRAGKAGAKQSYIAAKALYDKLKKTTE